MTVPAGFSLAGLPGPVAVVGSRHGSPYGVAQFVAALVQAGGVVRTGCAPGVDTAALVAVAQAGASFRTVSASLGAASAQPGHVQVLAAGHTPQHLAARTRLVVQYAAAVAVFPPAGGWPAVGPGSRLALGLAVRRRLPVFVAGPACPDRSRWVAATVAGVPGWVRSTPSILLLF